jgi:opacity protein-like surface antigen
MAIRKTSLCLLFLVTTLVCGNSHAENALMKLSNRQGGFEVLLQSKYTDSKSFEGQNGSSADVQDSWGWGFGFGYNFTEHLAFNFDISWRSANYDATIIVEDQDNPSNSGPKQFTGTLDTSSSQFSATYNFLDRRFTPYVSGILGWTFIDTNVPSGPPQNWCWWDPWWGYICSSYIPTHSETDFTYGGALGLRFDVTRTMFLRASYNKLWVDFKNASAEDFDGLRLDIGFLMN